MNHEDYISYGKESIAYLNNINKINSLDPSAGNKKILNWLTSAFKPYFQVNTSYVGKKLRIILCPYFHSDWKRIRADGSEELTMTGRTTSVSSIPLLDSGVNHDPTGVVHYSLPNVDINAPDMYIPSVSFVTAIILTGILAGLKQQFTPNVLYFTFTSLLVTLILQGLILGTGSYIFNVGTNTTIMDKISLLGYQNVGQCIMILFSECSTSTRILLQTWLTVANICFLYKSLMISKSRNSKMGLQLVILTAIIHALTNWILFH